MMQIKTSHRIFLCSIAVLSLTACESISWGKPRILSSDAGATQRDMEVSNSNAAIEENSSMTPMALPTVQSNEVAPPSYDNRIPTGDSSVEVYDMELNPGYQRGVSANNATTNNNQAMLTYGEEFKTRDSSVTIYGLDDTPPNMAGNPYGTYTPPAQNTYANNTYANNNSAGQIFFKHGSSRLGSGDMRKISVLADSAKFAPVHYITVEGFASRPTQVGQDSTQAHILNLRQSARRSEKVALALIKKGVPGEKIKTVSWGATKSTGDDTYDRRVDVVMGE